MSFSLTSFDAGRMDSLEDMMLIAPLTSPEDNFFETSSPRVAGLCFFPGGLFEVSFCSTLGPPDENALSLLLTTEACEVCFLPPLTELPSALLAKLSNRSHDSLSFLVVTLFIILVKTREAVSRLALGMRV